MTQEEINQLKVLLSKAWEIYPQADVIYVEDGNLCGRRFDMYTGTVTDYNGENPEGKEPFPIY